LQPGGTVDLGGGCWEIHGARGHDPHSVVLFQPDNRVLISADALWQNGFGVVFPELEGEHAFAEVEETLATIEALDPVVLIPGHGPWFDDLAGALSRARSRLDLFMRSPEKHQRHALKVLIKFRLLEWQQIERADLLGWCRQTPYLLQFMPDGAAEQDRWLNELLAELVNSRALRLDGDRVLNA
jgi:glyoxylase-like metal-dependent hydrolase (beta-lactamase superfamily II)